MARIRPHTRASMRIDAPLRSLARMRGVAGAVWLFVLALLIAAVAPLGPPETLVHGAAFNPATTSVAIAAKRGEQAAAADWHQGPERVRHDGAPGGAAALPATIAVPFGIAAASADVTATAGAYRHPAPRGMRRARAPPFTASA